MQVSKKMLIFFVQNFIFATDVVDGIVFAVTVLVAAALASPRAVVFCRCICAAVVTPAFS